MVLHRRPGFTLTEILIAVAIIGLMVAVMGPRLMQRLAAGRKGAAQSQLTQIKDGLLSYNMDIGRFPTTREGLTELLENTKNNPQWNGPYLAKEPVDPWGHPYIYNSPPEVFKQYKHFEIFSYGGAKGEATPQNQWIHDGE